MIENWSHHQNRVNRMGNMANIRIQINPETDDVNLSKLRRSLKVQQGIELEDEGNGIFLLVVKERVSIQTLGVVSELVQSFGFHFYYPDYIAEEDEHPAIPVEDFGTFFPDCTCKPCQEARAEYEKRLRAGDLLKRAKIVAEQRLARNNKELSEIKKAQVLKAMEEMKDKSNLMKRTKPL
jgi:hypothetical protein